MLAVRYGIPLVLLVAGVVVGATSGSGVAAGAMFISAGTAVLLLNVLYRIGVQGDRDRDREEEARRFFDEHGRWPDEPESAEAAPAVGHVSPSRSRASRPPSGRAPRLARASSA